VKVFHDAGQPTGDLAALGWSAQIRAAVENYIVGGRSTSRQIWRMTRTARPEPATGYRTARANRVR
jgi:hypothetical protein